MPKKRYSGPPDKKQCRECGEEKDIKFFPICDNRNGFPRYRANCKNCFNKKARGNRPPKINCQINDTERICTKCNIIKPNKEFTNIGKDNNTGIIYKNGVCKICMRDGELRKKYGISTEKYNEILLKQGGVCAICKKTNSGNKSLSVDHNHNNGDVRGLLCTTCNIGLGHFKADSGTDLLKSAIDYINLQIVF